MVSNVELFAQLAAQGGLNLQQYAIQVFTFVPDSSGYVVVLHKGDRSLTRCAWHNVPAGLDQLLEREAANGVRHVTAGMNGSYVVILNSGVVWWKGVPPTLNKLLDDAEKSGRGVKVKRCNFLLVAVDRELTRRSFLSSGCLALPCRRGLVFRRVRRRGDTVCAAPTMARRRQQIHRPKRAQASSDDGHFVRFHPVAIPLYAVSPHFAVRVSQLIQPAQFTQPRFRLSHTQPSSCLSYTQSRSCL